MFIVQEQWFGFRDGCPWWSWRMLRKGQCYIMSKWHFKLFSGNISTSLCQYTSLGSIPQWRQLPVFPPKPLCTVALWLGTGILAFLKHGVHGRTKRSQWKLGLVKQCDNRQLYITVLSLLGKRFFFHFFQKNKVHSYQKGLFVVIVSSMHHHGIMVIAV